jgi:hypothetical protein
MTRPLLCGPPTEIWTAQTYKYSIPPFYGSHESEYIVAHNMGPSANTSDNAAALNSHYLSEVLCGGTMTLTDMSLVLLTYCLVVIAWYQMRVSDENTKRIERAYIIGAGPYGLPKPRIQLPRYTRDMELRPIADHFREPRHMIIQNYGKTPGFITAVEWGLCNPDEFPKNISVSEAIDKGVFRDGIVKPVSHPSEVYPPSGGEWKTYRHIEFNRTDNIGKIFFGIIRYKDVFKESHFSTFKLFIDEQYSPTIDAPAEDWD